MVTLLIIGNAMLWILLFQWTSELKWKKAKRKTSIASELKKLWNMKVMAIAIVVGSLETVHKGLDKRLGELEIRGRIETIQITTLLGSIRIIRKVQETWGDLLDETDCISHSTNTLRKGMNPIILPPAMGK